MGCGASKATAESSQQTVEPEPVSNVGEEIAPISAVAEKSEQSSRPATDAQPQSSGKYLIKDMDLVQLRKYSNMFGSFDASKDRRLVILGRARGGFNLKLLYIYDSLSATVWRCDLAAIDSYIDTVSVYTLLSEAIARKSIKVVGGRSVAEQVEIAKMKRLADEQAKDTPTGSDQPEQPDRKDSSTSPSLSPKVSPKSSGIILVNHEAPALVLQLPIAPMDPMEVQRQSMGLWPESVGVTINARGMLCITCDRVESIEETHKLIAECMLSIYDALPVRRSSSSALEGSMSKPEATNAADDEIRSPDKFRVVPGVSSQSQAAPFENMTEVVPQNSEMGVQREVTGSDADNVALVDASADQPSVVPVAVPVSGGDTEPTSPSTAVKGKNRWRDRDGSLAVRKYGGDTALPIVKILAFVADIKDLFERRPELQEESDIRVDDLQYIEEVLANNKQYNPEFIARSLAAPSSTVMRPDEETGEFLISELTPYTKSAVESLSMSLTTIRSVLMFTRIIRRHAAVSFMKKEMSDVFRENFPQLKSYLDHVVRWDWDVFEFSHIARGRPLYTLAMSMFYRYDLFEKLGLNQEKVRSFFMDVENNYLNNPYHNRVHGTDVLQTVFYFLEAGNYRQYLSSADICAVIIAAAAHDVGHPGLANPFQIKTMSPLALKFNNQSVLEMFHCSFTFELLLKESNNFLADVDMETRLSIRDTIIALILATDMGRNFEYLGKFQTQLIKSDGSRFRPTNPDELRLMLQLMLKCADINNPAKNLNLYAKWVERVMEEFFLQGDREREMGLKVSPFMDRHTTDIGRCQLSFMDYVTLPLYETLANFDKAFMPCLDQLLENKQYWKERMEKKEPIFTAEMKSAVRDPLVVPLDEDNVSDSTKIDNHLPSGSTDVSDTSASGTAPTIAEEWKNDETARVPLTLNSADAGGGVDAPGRVEEVERQTAAPAAIDMSQPQEDKI
jgi:hypothetical protein